MDVFIQEYFNPALGYIRDSLSGMFAGVILYLLLLPHRKRRYLNHGLSFTLHHEILLFFLAAYFGALARLLLVPNESSSEVLFVSYPTIELCPTILLILTGKYIAGGWTAAMFIGNVLLFIPFGFGIQLLFQKYKWYKIVIIGAILSFSIESIQLLIGRAFDINDIIYNALGVILGCAFAYVIKKIFPNFCKKFISPKMESRD